MRTKILNILALSAAILSLLSCENRIDPGKDERIAVSAFAERLGVELKSESDGAAQVSVYNGVGIDPLYTKVIYSLGALHGQSYLTFNDENPEWIKDGDEYLLYNDETFSCIGLYPATEENDGWEISSDAATHTSDGSTDLMYAPEVTSDKNSTPPPTLNYKHLLTWVNVLVSANTIEAVNHWGKITKITIESSDNVEIGLTDDSISYSTTCHPITAYSSNTGLALNITTTPAGSVLISPKTTLKVTVYTTVFTEGKSVDITLRDMNNIEIDKNQNPDDMSEVRGKLFVLNLTFTPLSILEGTCTLNYWNDQDEDLFLS